MVLLRYPPDFYFISSCFPLEISPVSASGNCVYYLIPSEIVQENPV